MQGTTFCENIQERYKLKTLALSTFRNDADLLITKLLVPPPPQEFDFEINTTDFHQASIITSKMVKKTQNDIIVFLYVFFWERIPQMKLLLSTDISSLLDKELGI